MPRPGLIAVIVGNGLPLIGVIVLAIAGLFAMGRVWGVVALLVAVAVAVPAGLLSVDYWLRYGAVEYRTDGDAVVAFDRLFDQPCGGSNRGTRPPSGSNATASTSFSGPPPSSIWSAARRSDCPGWPIPNRSWKPSTDGPSGPPSDAVHSASIRLRTQNRAAGRTVA